MKQDFTYSKYVRIFIINAKIILFNANSVQYLYTYFVQYGGMHYVLFTNLLYNFVTKKLKFIKLLNCSVISKRQIYLSLGLIYWFQKSFKGFHKLHKREALLFTYILILSFVLLQILIFMCTWNVRCNLEQTCTLHKRSRALVVDISSKSWR